MRASAESPRLDVRERVPSGPTGALSVLFEAEGASVSGAHVAYPSGDAVVVAETHGGVPSTFSRVTFAGDEDEASSPPEPPTCVAWAPGETRGALLVARGCEIHLCAPAETPLPRAARAAADDESEFFPSPSSSAPSFSAHSGVNENETKTHAHAWERIGRARCAAKVTSAAWTNDGLAFASATTNGEIALWRVVRKSRSTTNASRNDSNDASCSFLLTPVWRASHQKCAATSNAGEKNDDAMVTIVAAGASARAPVASAARHSRDARVWDPRGTLAQTLRHPAAVTSARWRRDRLRDGGQEKDVALVTVSEDGAARVWTAAPAALGGGSRSTETPRLVQTVVAQTDPGPSGYTPALLAAHWLAWRPEPRGARRRGRDPAEGDAASEPQPPPPETSRKELEKETRDEDAEKTATKKTFDAFCAAAVPARDGADFLAALGSDGAVWVWMLEGFDETDSSASARVPRAHLWRRAPMLEEDATCAHRLAAASHPAYFSATWAPRRTRRGDVAANRPTHLPESHRDLLNPRGDPPPLRVVLASPDAGALVSEVDLAASERTTSWRELDASRNRKVLARSSAFRGHVDGDVVTLVRACDETGAVVSVDAGGGVRVWRWLDFSFCEESDDDEAEGVCEKRKRKRRLAPVSFREGSPRGVSAAAWFRGALFLATEDHLLTTHAFLYDDVSCVVMEKIASVTTRSFKSDRSDDQTIASLDAYDVSERDVSGAAAKTKTKGAPAAALAATRRDGEVLSWALVAKQNDGPLVPLVDGDAFSRVASCFPGTVPAVVPAGHTSTRARAFAAARVDARGDVALAACRLSAEAETEDSTAEDSTARVPRWTDAGCLRRPKTSSEEGKERKTETPTTLASSPTGAAVALALPDGRVEVWEAESDARGAFALAAEFRVGSDFLDKKCHLSWFDLGGGAEALAIARGARVEVRVARREAWRVLAAANLSRCLETGGEADPLAGPSPSRGGEVHVGGLAWSARGDALVVGVDHELVTLAPAAGASLAFLVAEAATALPEYHPRVLMDWLVRGETRRARAAARRVCARLRVGENANSNSSDDGGPSSVFFARAASVAQLLEDRVVVSGTLQKVLTNDSGDATPPALGSNGLGTAQAKKKMDPAPVPSLVPEFDAGAFGGFAGFGGAPAPARFGFGMDLKRDSLDRRLEPDSAVEDAISAVSRVGSLRNADEKDASARFSASEAEEAASLVASRVAARSLPGLTGAERVGLLATLDALRDADGGADAAVDEAGRRFRALRRARALRDARSRSLEIDGSDGSAAVLLDAHGPRGEELAWATQSDAQDALLASFGFSSADGSGSADGPDSRAWRALRTTGAPLWVRDDETLRKLIDAAARHAFASSRDPGGENPCALLFAALGRAATLAGVFRAARDARLADFFSRDFSERKNREAALKNAYALLSKHRYLFASAFFVLAGQPQDAAALVWKHVGDLSLAVAVARLAKDASLDDEIARETSSRSGAESRDEKKLGHSASDDGTLSASAFAGFGDFAGFGASPLDGRVARSSPDGTPREIKRTEEDANEEAPREKKEKKEEAPLPASLSPAAKAFVKARVVPDFEARFAASRGKNVEDAWTLAALRWLCGDGDASVETLRRLVRDESTSSEDKASAADLCAFVSRRRALLETAPALARDAADAAADATGALALALEAEGMPLAALERQERFPNENENERSSADDGSARFRRAERTEKNGSFPFGALAASAATRARADVIARLTATALAPETFRGTFPEASFRALARAAPAAFDKSAEAAARASLARRDASLAFSVASAEKKKKTRRGVLSEREPRPRARRESESLEPADVFAATEKALDSALDSDSALDPDATPSRRLPSVDLDPESARLFFRRDAGAADADADADANATPRAAKKVSGLKRLRDRLSVKIRGGASPRSPGGGGGDDGDGASPVGFGFSSPPDTPASPTSPAATPPPPSGFDVLMPGFGVSVLAETPARAAPPSFFVAADAAGPDGTRRNRNEQRGEPDGSRPGEPSPSRDAGGVFRRARDPNAFVQKRRLRTPVEIARLQGDAFYGACVNPAVPHQLGLACVKRGLVIADLRALAAQGAPRAPDGRAVVGAAAVLRAASASSTLARLWADPRDGRLNAGGLEGIAPWPRAAWWRPKRAARREMQSVGSRVGTQHQNNHSASDWTAAASSVAAAAAGAAASAAAAVGALELETVAPAFAGAGAPCSFRAPGDVVARCAEAHPREPVLIAGDAFGSVSIWRFAADQGDEDATGTFGKASAFLGAVRLPDARRLPGGAGGGAARAGVSSSSFAGFSYATRFDRAKGEARRQHTETAKHGSGSAILIQTAAETRGVSTSCAAWGPGGARFAAGGADGAAAVWRSDQFLDPSTAPASFRAPPHPGKSRVEAVSFASAAVVAAVGSHLAGGTLSLRDAAAGADAASLVLWDTLRASDAPPAAAVAAHEGGATALCWLPGLAHGASPWPLVATAGRDGDIAAHDLRKLGDGGAQTTVLWRARRVDSGVGHAAAVKSLAALSLRDGSGCALVSGCKDGDVRVWSCASGAHVQHLAGAHERHTFLAPRGGGRNVLQVGVSKLTPLAGGVLSCGGDGTVKLFRLAPEASDADEAPM